MLEKPVILSMDGFSTAASLLVAATNVLNEPQSDVVGHLKINDAVHLPDMSGPNLVYALKQIREDIKIFLDLKVGDVHATLRNIVSHYYSAPNILSVSSLIDAKGFLELRRCLPDTKLALFSVPTDMAEARCKERYDNDVAGKIKEDLFCLEDDYNCIKGEDDAATPVDLIICSPRELGKLSIPILIRKYAFICPGIRDEWMEDGKQTRTTGVKEALEAGAKYVVLGSQMLEGNPKRGVSPEESRRKTAEEIEMERLEGGGHA